MRISMLALAAALVGCSGDDPSPSNPDSAVVDTMVVPPDGEVPDAEIPDAEVPDAMPPCLECETGYVFDSLTVPTSAQESADLGFDLDGDGTVDNQMGNIFSALASVDPDSFSVQQ